MGYVECWQWKWGGNRACNLWAMSPIDDPLRHVGLRSALWICFCSVLLNHPKQKPHAGNRLWWFQVEKVDEFAYARMCVCVCGYIMMWSCVWVFVVVFQFEFWGWSFGIWQSAVHRIHENLCVWDDGRRLSVARFSFAKVKHTNHRSIAKSYWNKNVTFWEDQAQVFWKKFGGIRMWISEKTNPRSFEKT